MNKTQCIILMIILLLIFYCITKNNFFCEKYNNVYKVPIYCLMVTGKDKKRNEFAEISILNFNLQTYTNKKLVIINHGEFNIEYEQNPNIIYVKTDKINKTLGDLRNVSLKYVPVDSIWTTWDDDDWRSNDYLEKLYFELINSKSRMLLIKNRLEYNLQSKFAWESTMKSGFYWFFGFYDKRLNYESLDTFEDGIIKQLLKLYNIKTKIYDNDHRMYLRFVHKNNTSLFVDSEKKNIINYDLQESDFFEKNISEINNNYVNYIVDKYYVNIIKKYY